MSDRDLLGGDFLAGLTVGGEEHGWVAWLTARIDTYTDAAAANAAHLQLKSDFSGLLKQRLPTYWTGTTG